MSNSHADFFTSGLRSSAAPKGDRQRPLRAASCLGPIELRSSAAPKGDRQHPVAPHPPPPRMGCDPRPPRRATASRGDRVRLTSEPSSCDPRPPRRATASDQDRARGAVRGGCDPRPPRRATASRGDRVRLTSEPSSCDPRPPRRATASPRGLPGHPRRWGVAILGRPEGRPPVLDETGALRVTLGLRSSAAPKGDRQRLTVDIQAAATNVAILGRPEGRPPAPVSPGRITRR